MSDIKALQQERTQLFVDLVDGKIPKRVPISHSFALEFAIQYAGKDLAKTQWDTSTLEEIFEKICQDFISDTLPAQAFRFPSWYKILGARNFVMSSSGFLQHPDVSGMEIEDYDAFIESPFDCIVERVLPRLYTELDKDPHTKAMNLAKAFTAFNDDMGRAGMLMGKMVEKYGYAHVNNFAGFCEAPFDFLTDLLRGFKNVMTDIRRLPDKVEAAVEAVTPWMIKMGTYANPAKTTATFIPLHMAPYMRPKDFARFYWPTFKKTVEGLKEAGTASFLFVEHDWMPHIDYLEELPENTIMMFEYGDPKVVKEKLGHKHILTGFYPITLLKTGTKEQCVDKAKELLDILAPGGKYYFGFDKSPITLDSIKVENLHAVLDYVAANGKY